MSKQQTVKTEPAQKGNQTFVFERMNYILMLVGLGIIGLGYVLMIGGGSDDPNVFSDALFSFRRITLSPILILLGFVVEIFAIMYRPKNKKDASE